MPKHKRLEPGQICIFDKNNFSCSKTNQILYLSIIKEMPKKLFGKRDYLCAVVDKDEIIKVNETYLYPIYETEDLEHIKQITVIRNPVNMPEITDYDMQLFEAIKEIIEKSNKEMNLGIDSYIKDLNKLYIKLKFYSSMMNPAFNEEYGENDV